MCLPHIEAAIFVIADAFHSKGTTVSQQEMATRVNERIHQLSEDAQPQFAVGDLTGIEGDLRAELHTATRAATGESRAFRDTLQHAALEGSVKKMHC